MTGNWNFNITKWSHICFDFKSTQNKIDVSHVFFEDPRCFATMDFFIPTTLHHAQKYIQDLAPSWLSTHHQITLEKFISGIQHANKKYLVCVLMDQRQVCSGIGNYLLSEIMYACKLHPDIRCNQLSVNVMSQIYHNATKIIQLAYTLNGATFKNFLNVDTTPGTYSTKMQVYGQSHDIHGNVVSTQRGHHGRTIHFVENLQKLPC